VTDPILSEEVDADGATILRTDVAVDTMGTIVLTPAGARLGLGNRAAQLQVARARAVKGRAGGADGQGTDPDGAR
jgi:hypothetical protein